MADAVGGSDGVDADGIVAGVAQSPQLFVETEAVVALRETLVRVGQSFEWEAL